MKNLILLFLIISIYFNTSFTYSNNSNITLNAENNVNIATAILYNRLEDYNKTKSTFSKSETYQINETLENISSNINSTNNLTIVSNKQDINILGSNITSNNNIDLEAKEGNVNILNAMDSNYSYYYHMQEKFDVAGALANITTAVAVGALTGGAGMLAIGAGAGIGASQMTKGKVDIKMTYDEKVIGSNITSGNNINISTKNNATLRSSNLNAANDINMNIGNELLIGTDTEKHQSYSKHETWGGDLGMAALSGAITGLVGGLGGHLGNFTGISSNLMGGASALSTSSASNAISKNLKGFSDGIYTTNQVGSDVLALNNVNMTTNNDLNIVGSDLSSGNDILLQSNNGSVNILSAIETETKESSRTKTNFGGINFSHTNSSVGVDVSVEKHTTTNTTTTQTAKSSNLNSGNNITIKSGNNTDIDKNNKQDINIIGSNVFAENDIDITSSQGNINVVSQELLQNALDKQKTETITVSAGITNYWVKTAEQGYNIVNNSKAGQRDNKEGYVNTFFDVGNAGLSLANALSSSATLGFGASASISYNNTETTTTTDAIYNKNSAIISNSGNIDLSAEKDITIKGSTIATNGEDKEINLISNNGDINILASKDTTNIDSNTDSYGVSIDLSLIPTYSQNNSNTTITQETYNNSIIQANGNNSKINIKSNNNDINIKGANMEANSDINLLAVNGNTNIESNQDKYYSDTDTYGFQVGGTIGFNLGKDYQKDITNNYTTIKSNNGNTNIETNNLKLVGIQDEVKNNMNTDLVKGNISETQLKEKHDSEYYDLGISYNLPLSIGNLNQKVNDVIAGGIDTVANTLSNSNNTMVSSIGNGISNISKPNVNNNTLQPKTDSQSIMNVGNWSDSFKNTTVSYKDDNGFDFSASVNSTAQSVVLTGKGLKYGMIGTEEIVEFGRETLGKMDVPGIILSQPLSAIEGFLDYFVENDSVVINNKGEKAKTGDENYEDIIKSGKHYQVNGINTTEGYATDRVVNPNNDLSQRYNPTSGALGDLIESGLGKLFNWNGYTAMLGSMNREVANDLIVRSNIKDSSNSFHSQGTIIGMGALNILGTFYKDVKIDDSQRFDFAGPAIYRQDAERAVGNVMDEKWLETAKKNEDIYNGAKGKQFEFNHIPTDFVNITTSPTLKNIKDGFKYGWSLEDHNFDTNPLYNKNVRKDGYFDTLQGQRELLEIEIIKVLYDIKD